MQYVVTLTVLVLAFDRLLILRNTDPLMALGLVILIAVSWAIYVWKESRK